MAHIKKTGPMIRWSCGHLLHDINKHGSSPYLRPMYFHYASAETLNRRPKGLSSPDTSHSKCLHQVRSYES